jgi:uncharacterized protein YabE (DUF348 family)
LIPLVKNIKRYFSLKEIVIVALAIIISISAGFGVFQFLKKEVQIHDDGKVTVVSTMKTTVSEVLEQNGITLSSDDYINVGLDRKLHRINKNEIYIKRAIPVYVLADGQENRIMTYKDTVREALENSVVKLNENDRLENLSLDDKIVRDMQINVVRVKEETVKESIAIPYRVVSRQSDKLDKGTEKVVRDGKEGVREKTFRVVYENGKEIVRELVKDAIAANPVDRIVDLGTVLNFKTSRGETVRYKKAMSMRATSYTASYEDTGKNPGDPGFGITYTGMKVRRGVIAVDPRVIPLGTRVYIEGVGKVPDYGFAVAADIGGAIKGDKIDLYFEDGKSVRNWGIRKVKVYILTN